MAAATRPAFHLARPSLNIPRLDVHLHVCPCCSATSAFVDCARCALASPSKRLVSSTLEYSLDSTTTKLFATSTALPTPISPTMAQLVHRWPLPQPSADAAEDCSVSTSVRRPPSVLSQASALSITPSTNVEQERRVNHERALAYQRKLDQTPASRPVYNTNSAGMSQQSASCIDTRDNRTMNAQANTVCTVLPTPRISPLERLETSLLPSLEAQLPTPLTPSSSMTTTVDSTSSYRHAVRYGAPSSEPSARVKTPDVVNSRSLDAIHGRDRSQSVLFTLPNETLSHILSFLPLSCLPSLMRGCSHLHALSERILYHTLQHIQFYSPPDAAYLQPADSPDATFTSNSAPSRSKDWALIYTLSTRPSAARCVRHFAVRGLPWLGEDEVGLLARALRGMQSGLVSLEINLGIPVERALVRTLSNLGPISSNTHAEPDGFVNLSALNVLDAQTALWFLGARQDSLTPATQRQQINLHENHRVPSSVNWNGKDAGSVHEDIHAIDGGLQTPSARSPLSVLRIDFQHPLDAAGLNELLSALVPQSQAKPRHGEDVQQLQLGLQCRSADEASAMAFTVARRLPTLRLLGLHVYPCSPEEQVLDFMATSYDVVARSLQSTATGEKQMEKTWDLSMALNDALSHLPLLHTLSLAYSLPFTMGQSKCNAEALAYHSTQSSLHDHRTPCGGSLNLLELQWSAWHLVPPRATASSSLSREATEKAIPRTWTAIPANSHQFIRLGWAYANASFV